jgi:hypothetical protein
MQNESDKQFLLKRGCDVACQSTGWTGLIARDQ